MRGPELHRQPGLWTRIREAVTLPLEEKREHGPPELIRERLKVVDSDEVASILLAEAEEIDREPRRRRDGAERRASTLQGAVAIAASFGVAAAALALSDDGISGWWRYPVATCAFSFVLCLAVAGERAISALGRTHLWNYPHEDFFELVSLTSKEAKLEKTARLLEGYSQNMAITRRKVDFMRQAAWWFRLALVFLVADAAFLSAYAIFA